MKLEKSEFLRMRLFSKIGKFSDVSALKHILTDCAGFFIGSVITPTLIFYWLFVI